MKVRTFGTVRRAVEKYLGREITANEQDILYFVASQNGLNRSPKGLHEAIDTVHAQQKSQRIEQLKAELSKLTE